MLSKSAEIRWWSSEQSEMLNWFENNVQNLGGLSPDERTDFYTKTSSDRIGVKWREGKLEFKCRISRLNAEFGWVETYLKESFPSELEPTELPFGDMIATKKKRHMCVFIPDKGTIIEVGTDADTGCQIEFTEVCFDSENVFYSIGLEAFSSTGEEIELLQEMMKTIPLKREIFTLENSFGYAALIKKLALKNEL